MYKLKVDDRRITYGNESYILQRINDKKWDFKEFMQVYSDEKLICNIERFTKSDDYYWYDCYHGGDEDYVITKYSQDNILNVIIDSLTVCDYIKYNSKWVTAHS